MKPFKTKKDTELPLLDLRGKPYLQVAYRLVWFREEKPDWSIETEIVHTDDKETLAKAVIKDPSGRIMNTGHKTETVQGFQDHLEKAETGAVGRALAMLGYGTQFAPELEEGDRIVDAPVRPAQPAPGDGIRPQPNGTFIKYGPLANQYMGNVPIPRLRAWVLEEEQKAVKLKKEFSPAMKRLIDEAAQLIAKAENQGDSAL
jgi:hypothetical protein